MSSPSKSPAPSLEADRDSLVPGTPANVDDQARDNANSIFPAPPKALYLKYTNDNVSRLRAQQDGSEIQLPAELMQLMPPKLDWIIEDGHWNAFGQNWPIHEELPSLEALGIPVIYQTSADRRTSLHALLQSMLKIYLAIIDTLLKSPPSNFAQQNNLPNDLTTYSNNLQIVSISMHHLLNELRPIQARETLLNLRRRRIEEKRLKISLMSEKTKIASTTLETLKAKNFASPTMGQDVDMLMTSNDTVPIDRLWEQVHSI